MSETHVLPLLQCRGGLGRKGSLPVEARKAGEWGCTCALFLCEIIWVDLIYIFFGAADNVLVYTILLIISVRRPVFYRYRITIKYTKKRHYCIFDFHLNVIFNTQRRFFSYSSDKAI